MLKKLNKLKSMTRAARNILISKTFNKRMPIFVCFGLTSMCNLRCKYCYANIEQRYDLNPHQGYSKEEVFRIVDDFYELGTGMIFLSGGEPLMHENIEEIVNYIVGKGIHLDILTNGTLVEKKIDKIKNAHNVCFSLDGEKDFNDEIRGKGVFDRVLKGIDACRENNITSRIHAVMTKGGLNQLEYLAELCKEKKVALTYSPPGYIGESSGQEIFDISDEEYREFWKTYKKLKKQGYPIGNSYYAIDKVINWPTRYHNFIKKDEKFDNYKPVHCGGGKYFCGLDSDGTLFNCYNAGANVGYNIKELGVKKAWEKALDYRKDCYSCSSLNLVELSTYMNLEPSMFIDAIKYNLLK